MTTAVLERSPQITVDVAEPAGRVAVGSIITGYSAPEHNKRWETPPEYGSRVLAVQMDEYRQQLAERLKNEGQTPSAPAPQPRIQPHPEAIQVPLDPSIGRSAGLN